VTVTSTPIDPGRPRGAASLADSLAQSGRYLSQSLRLMIGVPDYGTYLRHPRAQHPDAAPMSYEEFFRERQQARYGGKGRMGRCC
jgi:uncharacterized short protein YbdD (DUF466 family)